MYNSTEKNAIDYLLANHSEKPNSCQPTNESVNDREQNLMSANDNSKSEILKEFFNPYKGHDSDGVVICSSFFHNPLLAAHKKTSLHLISVFGRIGVKSIISYEGVGYNAIPVFGDNVIIELNYTMAGKFFGMRRPTTIRIIDMLRERKIIKTKSIIVDGIVDSQRILIRLDVNGFKLLDEAREHWKLPLTDYPAD